jgi:hypothetical protein
MSVEPETTEMELTEQVNTAREMSMESETKDMESTKKVNTQS